MISPSDEVGITTIEKLSSIKGFSGVVDLKAFVKQITDIRCAVALQAKISPCGRFDLQDVPANRYHR
jgi:thymidine phosphorylase